MAHVASMSLIRQLGSLFEGGSAAGLSDRQLLERFATGCDEGGQAAFAALVARHGPMVLGVCRQLLGDHQHAEDAFQAVFLVLARKARSIREPELLGNWLYGVALRTARKARGRLARRRQTEEQGAMVRPEARPAVQAEQMIDREQAEALHREIDRLPGAFRTPIVLCYFEGLSPDEAAARLRWPSGTLRSRLVRARDKLRRGLARRGVVLSGTALAAALAPRSAWASVSPLLCDSTTRAAIAFAARHAVGGALSAPAAALAQEVLKSMLIHKLRFASLTVLALAAIATGAGLLTPTPAMQEGPGVQPTASKSRATDRPRPAEKAGIPDEGRMTVTGRVFLPDGKPAAGVPVDIIGSPRAPTAGTDVEREGFVVLGRGTAEGDGRFRIEASRASSARYYAVYALAGAAGPGTAFGSVSLHPDAEQPTAEVHLQPEQVIRGKLLDVNGQPAAEVEVGLKSVYTESSSLEGGRFDSPAFALGYVWTRSPGGLNAWPKPVATDAQGRFAFAGVGRGLHAGLAIHDPRFAQQHFEFPATDRDPAKEVSLALRPSTIIEGSVRTADTGQAVPDAVISVRASSGVGGGMFPTRFRADGQGRFRINPFAGDYFRMRAYPSEGQPYLVREADLQWTKGAVRKQIDITLPRGVLIRGRVTEQGTGRSVAGASVQFFPTRGPGDIISGFEAIVRSGDDGRFQVAVPPGKGYLLVLGPTLGYVPQEIGGGKLYGSGQPGGMRFYAHDVIAYEATAGGGPVEVDAKLRPGKTIRGRVVGPAGETVEDAVVLTRQQLDPINLTWQKYNFIQARDGRFELPGFDPEKASPAYFLDPDHQWGAAVEFSGKQAGEEVTTRLQPCGRAKARFVGPGGKPVARFAIWPYLHLVMAPGPDNGMRADRGDQPAADQAFLPNLDPKHYPNDLKTDAEGRVELPGLIPGAPYRISDWSTVNDEKGIQVRKDFTVKPGETLDLGDILVEKPRR